ncbi:hypothetical protein O181_034724 [Austropuccinia psidii MF-1]|uniref:Riboflavin kinase n=1 Tax=Austropuccinia psidii MF-1 TaxID=1389203 RepID=A0A9Q3H9U1_9BASI|nr:hypothetical protein [Austropuccinia psidii MF-1]
MSTIISTQPAPHQPKPKDEPRPLIIGSDHGPEAPFPVQIQGIVQHGFGRGAKELGCPTANLPEELTKNSAFSRNGIYFGWASLILSDSSQPPTVKPMVMSVGYNPVFGNSSRTIEVHIIHDFNHDFYGELVKAIVTGFIRPEYHYTSKEALIEDIEIDKRAALESLKRPSYQAFADEKFLVENVTSTI